MLGPLELRCLLRRSAVGDLGNAERQPAPLIAVAVQIRVEIKLRDGRQQVGSWALAWHYGAVPPGNQLP